MTRSVNPGDLAKLQVDTSKWAEKTFPGQTIQSKIKHLVKELTEELAAKPRDKSEQADCLLLFLHIVKLGGSNAADLIAAGFDKLEINKAREWEGPDADGVYHHKKREEETAA